MKIKKLVTGILLSSVVGIAPILLINRSVSENVQLLDNKNIANEELENINDANKFVLPLEDKTVEVIGIPETEGQKLWETKTQELWDVTKEVFHNRYKDIDIKDIEIFSNNVNENYKKYFNFKLLSDSKIEYNANHLKFHSPIITRSREINYDFNINETKIIEIIKEEMLKPDFHYDIESVGTVYGSGTEMVYMLPTFISIDNSEFIKLKIWIVSRGWGQKGGWLGGYFRLTSKLNIPKLTIQRPNLQKIYTNFLTEVSSNNYIPTIDDLFLTTDQKTKIIKDYYSKLIETEFAKQTWKDKKVFAPKGYTIGIENDLKNGKTFLTFTYNNWDNVPETVTIELNNSLFLKGDDISIINNPNTHKTPNIVLNNVNNWFPEDFIYSNHFKPEEYTTELKYWEASKFLNDNIVKYSQTPIVDPSLVIDNTFISTIFNKTHMINKFLNQDNLPSDTKINYDFSVENNEIQNISNGELTVQIKFGELFHRLYENNSTLINAGKGQIFKSTISGFKTQYDIYQNKSNITNLDTSKPINMLNENIKWIDISNVEGLGGKDLNDPDFSTAGKIIPLILDNLICYDNQNGLRINKDENKLNKIITTNLSKEDFKNNLLTNNDPLITFDQANGRIAVSFNFKDKLGTPFRDNKPEIGGYTKTSVINNNSNVTFFLEGFQRNYNIAVRNDTKLKASDLNSINTDGTSIKFDTLTTEDIVNALLDKTADSNKNLTYQKLIRSLIQFKFDLTKISADYKPNYNKLLVTYLDEVSFIKNTGFSFLKDDIFRKDVSGIVESKISFSNSSIYDSNKNIIGQEIEGFKPTTSDNTTISFSISGLKQFIKFYEYGKTSLPIDKQIFDISNNNIASNKKVKDFIKDGKINFINTMISYKNKPNKNAILSTNATYEEITDLIDSFEFIPNNPIGELEVKIKFKKVNGLFNNTAFTNNEPPPPELNIKLIGFKKDMNVSNNVRTINVKDIKKPTEEDIKINDINQAFILENLISYSNADITPNATKILNVNVTKEEFEKHLLENITINQSPENGYVSGIIKLKPFNGSPNNKTNDMMDSFTKEINFKIIGFISEPTYEVNTNAISITNFSENFEPLDIENFDKNFIVNKMINYKDVNHNNNNNNIAHYALKTSLTKSEFINQYLKEIIITQNVQAKTVDIKFIIKDLVEQLGSVTITGFKAISKFEIFEQIINHKLDDTKNINDVSTKAYVLNDLFLFNKKGSGINSGKYLLETNISKEEFEKNYLDKLIFTTTELDKFNNEVNFKMLLNKPINGKIEYTFKAHINTNKAFVSNIKNEFDISSIYPNLIPSQFTQENIISLISAIGQDITSSIFKINQNIDDVNKFFEITSIPNDKIGILDLTFNPINMVDNIGVLDPFNITISGFKNNISFIENLNVVDTFLFTQFDSINTLEDITNDFIINNLIMFSDSLPSTNIFGSFNLTKEEFKQLLNDIDLIVDGNKLRLNIKLKNYININQRDYSKNIQTTLVNLPFLNNEFDNSNLIIILATTIPITLILLLIFSIVLIKFYKKRKFQESIENNI